jgi:hypothetical protein
MPADGAAPIAAVVARMEAIGAGLSEDDGVACFNELYLAVTREVGAQAGAGSFADEAYLSTLDVGFAELYFAAVDVDARGAAVPHAWAPLFEARGRKGVAAIQFALAGMNAHINHDLVLALNTACDRRGVALKRNSAQHRDFLKVNDTLERVQDRIKARYAHGLVGWADKSLGRLDDVVAAWKVARARDAAWTNAEALRALRRVPRVRDDYLETLGRTVGLVSRALLVPTA